MSPVFDNIDQFVDGFLTSLEIILWALAGALPLGVLIAACRVSPIPPLRAFGTFWVTTFRNTPLTVVLFFCAFGFPELGINRSFFFFGVLGLVPDLRLVGHCVVKLHVLSVDRRVLGN